jgi:hypothetical protein
MWFVRLALDVGLATNDLVIQYQAYLARAIHGGRRERLLDEG